MLEPILTTYAVYVIAALLGYYYGYKRFNQIVKNMSDKRLENLIKRLQRSLDNRKA